MFCTIILFVAYVIERATYLPLRHFCLPVNINIKSKEHNNFYLWTDSEVLIWCIAWY